MQQNSPTTVEVGKSCSSGWLSELHGYYSTAGLTVGVITCTGTVHPDETSQTLDNKPSKRPQCCVDWFTSETSCTFGVPLGPVLVPHYFVALCVTLTFNFLFLFEAKNIEKLFHLHKQPQHHMAHEMFCKNFKMYIFFLLLPRWQVVVFMGRRRFLELLNNVFLI